MADIRIKRGTSLSLMLAFANADGSAFDVSTVTLSGTVRDSRETLVAVLTPVPTGVPGQASILVSNTTSWPEGLLRADFFVVAANTQAISQSFGIKVERGVTQLSPEPPAYNPVLAP